MAWLSKSQALNTIGKTEGAEVESVLNKVERTDNTQIQDKEDIFTPKS